MIIGKSWEINGKKEIIAVVGMCGAGKSVVSDFLKSQGYQFLRFGQITLDEAKRRGVSGESAERAIREEFRREHGMAAFAVLNKPRIDELLEKGNVVIDGLYSWSEYKFLNEQYGEMLKVLAVWAPSSLRYSRLEARTSVDVQQRNRPFSKQEAIARDYAEIENIEKGGPIAMADILIKNNSTFENMLQQLTEIFAVKKVKTRPSWDEYFMKMAALVAERSNCLRHNVGAIIVKGKRVLTTGYNGAVKSMPDCLELGCLRDKLGIASGTRHEICRAIHAEQNAIIQAGVHGINIDGGTIYSTHTPCMICAKMLVNAGIKEVVSYYDYADEEARNFLAEAGILLRKVNKPKSEIKFKD